MPIVQRFTRDAHDNDKKDIVAWSLCLETYETKKLIFY